MCFSLPLTVLVKNLREQCSIQRRLLITLLSAYLQQDGGSNARVGKRDDLKKFPVGEDCAQSGENRFLPHLIVHESYVFMIREGTWLAFGCRLGVVLFTGAGGNKRGPLLLLGWT